MVPSALNGDANRGQLIISFANRGQLIISFGEMLIDSVSIMSGVSLVEAPGRSPANVAIAVSRIDGSVAFMGKLSNEEFGRMLASILKENA